MRYTGSSRTGERLSSQEYGVKRAVIVSTENQRRIIQDRIEVLPWPEYLAELWSGALGV